MEPKAMSRKMCKLSIIYKKLTKSDCFVKRRNSQFALSVKARASVPF